MIIGGGMPIREEALDQVVRDIPRYVPGAKDANIRRRAEEALGSLQARQATPANSTEWLWVCGELYRSMEPVAQEVAFAVHAWHCLAMFFAVYEHTRALITGSQHARRVLETLHERALVGSMTTEMLWRGSVTGELKLDEGEFYDLLIHLEHPLGEMATVISVGQPLLAKLGGLRPEAFQRFVEQVRMAASLVDAMRNYFPRPGAGT